MCTQVIRTEEATMAVMPAEVQDLFKKVSDVVFTTASADGQPNSCIVGMKAVIDDETVYLSDQFFKKTLANVQANPKVAIVFWEGINAFELHGTARYVNEGPEFEAQKAWVDAAFEQMGKPIKAKGGCFVHVDAVFTSAPGPMAGDKIA
ncbi:MAG: pyridoxamine 5'-phosphate oxidase family protein [Eggerthellaceae bacterium]|nr:pyridoxamine 5'-phosphate oxidase family protein [Eggerthellaceae bacterium]